MMTTFVVATRSAADLIVFGGRKLCSAVNCFRYSQSLRAPSSAAAIFLSGLKACESETTFPRDAFDREGGMTTCTEAPIMSREISLVFDRRNHQVLIDHVPDVSIEFTEERLLCIGVDEGVAGSDSLLGARRSCPIPVLGVGSNIFELDDLGVGDGVAGPGCGWCLAERRRFAISVGDLESSISALDAWGHLMSVVISEEVDEVNWCTGLLIDGGIL